MNSTLNNSSLHARMHAEKKNNRTTVFQGHLNMVVKGLGLVGKSLQEHF